MEDSKNHTTICLIYAGSQSKKAQTEVSEQVNNRIMQQPDVLDPVCGMKVDPSKAAASIEHQGATAYFCSKGCAAKFRAAPDKYLQAKPVTPASQPAPKIEQQREYTCPMQVPEMRHGA
jgi:Cu+-exporting ATPase